VTLQFLVTKQNEHQIEEIRAIQKKFNADNLSLKTIQVYDMLGKDIKAYIIDNEIKGLSSGMYIVVVDGYFKAKLIVK
jgi:hypothetical protein